MFITTNCQSSPFSEINQWYRMYLTAHERLQVAGVSQVGEQIYAIINPQLKLVMEYGGDKQRENLPTTSEVAAIIPDEDDPSHRDIVVERREHQDTHPSLSSYRS